MPLEAINAAAAKEKSPRRGHPSTLHLWWARRPLAAARAVIWASLVDDPSSHPEKYPTPEEQNSERERLFKVLEGILSWEDVSDDRAIKAAKDEIMASMGTDVPPLLDPFAGGGAIPLEGQRLGLEAYAQDLNPVAVTINKAMIEIPPRFKDAPAVNPESQSRRGLSSYSGYAGISDDISYYGDWMREEVTRRVGHLYPRVTLPTAVGGGAAPAIAWIWSRTVDCPNPACDCKTPLVRSFDLSRKKGKEQHVEPLLSDEGIKYSVQPGKSKRSATIDRRGAVCIKCGAPITLDYIRDAAKFKRMGCDLMAVVADAPTGRYYSSPDESQKEAAYVTRPEEYPSGALFGKAQVNIGLYGLNETSDLFTNRQLTVMQCFSEVIHDVAAKAAQDAAAAGMSADPRGLSDNGAGAIAYGQAIGLYLQFAMDKALDRGTSLCCWDAGYQKIGNTFGRQALPMRWMFAESNPLGDSTGSFSGAVKWVADAVSALPASNTAGIARQFDAQSDSGLRDVIVSTDPPYYDNIDYADLSDFFYVWDRASLREFYPDLFGTILVPKEEELVAAPYRFANGKAEAKEFFEEGMRQVFRRLYVTATDDVPVTVYYGYKQSESEKKENGEVVSSSGWETMLQAIIDAGFSITGTWPMRTELTTALKNKMNALATSVVLVCRKRPDDAPMATRRDFVNTLKRELKPALDKLQTSNIAPVDLAQSAIGPGIGVYSRFSKVLEANGSEMTVRAALQIINQELDLYFSDQDNDLDRDSRFCVDLYTSYAFNQIRFGDADNLARAKNTSTDGIAARGALSSSKGIVRLLGRDELKETPDPSFCWLFTQQLTHAMETGGIEACAQMIKGIYDSRAENAKALAYRLFTIADKKGWAQEAFAYNSLVVAWPDIQDRAAQLQAQEPVQYALDLDA